MTDVPKSCSQLTWHFKLEEINYSRWWTRSFPKLTKSLLNCGKKSKAFCVLHFRQMSHSSINSDEGAATKIRVAVRLRPVLKESDKDKKPCVRGLDETSLEIWNWRDCRQTLKYNFDVFLDAASRQRDVYNRCVKMLITKTLQGQNASIFAYGPTGAGRIPGRKYCLEGNIAWIEILPG